LSEPEFAEFWKFTELFKSSNTEVLMNRVKLVVSVISVSLIGFVGCTSADIEDLPSQTDYSSGTDTQISFSSSSLGGSSSSADDIGNDGSSSSGDVYSSQTDYSSDTDTQISSSSSSLNSSSSDNASSDSSSSSGDVYSSSSIGVESSSSVDGGNLSSSSIGYNDNYGCEYEPSMCNGITIDNVQTNFTSFVPSDYQNPKCLFTKGINGNINTNQGVKINGVAVGGGIISNFNTRPKIDGGYYIYIPANWVEISGAIASSPECDISICGNKTYDLSTHFCVSPTAYEKCSGATYSPTEQFCSDNRIYSKCNGKDYNIETEFCYSDVRYSKCGGEIYNPSTHTCDKEIVKTKCGSAEVPIPAGHFCDERSAIVYRTVTINGQTWMAEDLKSSTTCPDGWYMPSREDWEALISYVGGINMLRATSGWEINSTDSYGFTLLNVGGGSMWSASNARLFVHNWINNGNGYEFLDIGRDYYTSNDNIRCIKN
jgi:hypothetical protein